ncbi:Disease resistance family protein / LRR family protein, putative [Theobroma cacao]|uniref:Disease resistance family protein / LRR family protein, putative n=1 Tax=Theobroma cacao TaxID=3641 RepID=A0A061FYM6_THECC|nr:Disease resistance family protein / LRR family protein, putative [Theobroma cacao]
MLPDLSSVKFEEFPGMDLSFNMFEGPLPVLPYNMTSIILAKNRFSGSVSSLCKIAAGTLSMLDLSDNLLCGVLPDCFFHWQNLSVLNLANNNFSGVIPITVGSLLSIETINLRNNSFSGDLPSSLKNCNRLKFLDLSENMFSGSIPAWIGENLSSLIFLSLHANEFYGRIPANLCQLANIRILDLSQNNLSGALPLCLNNLIAMVKKGDPNDIIEQLYWSSGQDLSFTIGFYIAKAWVGWKGKKYEYERSLGLFRIIDLASNKLDGEIPDEITRLSELVALNLSGNNLIGFIPENIGQLKQLESLDLSNNQLSGRIPNSMADLNFLSYLNLSYNNLSGKIPTSTQLQSLDASAFIGNQALYGPPITQQCPKNDTFQPQPPEEERDEFSRWLYIGMGIGFFMAFWGVIGTLLLKRSWRHAYFRLLDNWTDSLHVTFMLWSARLERKFKS